MLKNLRSALFILSTLWFCRCGNPETSKEIYEKGTEILAREGPTASRDFFQENALETGDETALFGIAWSHLARGDLIDAEEVCAFLLAQTEDPAIALKCHYLLGHLMTRTGRFADAGYYFALAESEYRKLGDPVGLYRTYLGLSNLMIQKKDFAEAERYLVQAASFQQQGLDYLVYLGHAQKLAFLKGDFTKALTYSRLKLETARDLGYKNLIADSLSGHGLNLMLNGDFEKGRTLTEEAGHLIDLFQSQEKFQYNQLNILLYRRCRGGETVPIIEEIDRWIEAQGDVVLKEYLDFVLEWPCP